MEVVTSDGLIAILVSIFASFCLGIVIVLIAKRSAEKHWRERE